MPLDASGPKRSQALDDELFKALMAQLPERDRASFSTRQYRALETACQNLAWGRHPVNLRLSIPLLVRRIYLVVLLGIDRRAKQRSSRSQSR